MLSYAASPVNVEDTLCLRLTRFVSLLRGNSYAVGLEDAVLLVEAASGFESVGQGSIVVDGPRARANYPRTMQTKPAIGCHRRRFCCK